MKICKVPEAISGLNRFWGRSCLLVAVLLLAELAKATVPTAQAGEKDDVEALLQLENDMAQAWVQRDAQTLVRILADDYTLGGTGDSLIKKRSTWPDLIIQNSGPLLRSLTNSGYVSMTMQPSLQAALFTGVGLKRAESTFTASGLLIPSSGVTVLGNV
jgi:hypothetical protein